MSLPEPVDLSGMNNRPLSPDEVLTLCKSAVGWLLYLRQGAWDFPRFEAAESALYKMRLVPVGIEGKPTPVCCQLDWCGKTSHKEGSQKEEPR